MNDEKIHLLMRTDAAPMTAAIEEFGRLLELPDSELEVDLDGLGKIRHLVRKLFSESVLDFSKLVRIDSHVPAPGAADVLLSFHPTDLFLELIAALRAGDRDGV